ncbi:hypothetical protein Fcan01_27728 [Folsomia candida]|uniref:Uncharacterized protein n=1 Tax=Folsomia candida TaxID=158441 RepID=A0A226CY60_FOLCA|nr:hypothetical protein Fcan01_27728 [Folsomia candida]
MDDSVVLPFRTNIMRHCYRPSGPSNNVTSLIKKLEKPEKSWPKLEVTYTFLQGRQLQEAARFTCDLDTSDADGGEENSPPFQSLLHYLLCPTHTMTKNNMHKTYPKLLLQTTVPVSLVAVHGEQVTSASHSQQVDLNFDNPIGTGGHLVVQPEGSEASIYQMY